MLRRISGKPKGHLCFARTSIITRAIVESLHGNDPTVLKIDGSSPESYNYRGAIPKKRPPPPMSFSRSRSNNQTYSNGPSLLIAPFQGPLYTGLSILISWPSCGSLGPGAAWACGSLLPWCCWAPRRGPGSCWAKGQLPKKVFDRNGS